MNSHDLNNLNYILSLNESEFDEWILTLGDDDITYAIEVIQHRRAELALQEARLIDEVEDMSEAQSVLSKFTLKG